MADGKKKRKWVVRAMISFVAILALLTFFSNTIMNATIPKVMGQNAVRGNLSYTNSETGTIVADLKTDVKSLANREIDKVLVNNYTRVEAGDPVVTLKPIEDGDDASLEELRNQLQTAQRAQRDYEMGPDVDTSCSLEQAAVDNAQDSLSAANSNLEDARNRDSIIDDANSRIESYSTDVNSLQATVDAEAAIVADYNDQIAQLDIEINNTQIEIDTLINLGVPTPTPVPSEPVAESSETATNPQTDNLAQLQSDLEDLESQKEDLESLRDDASARQSSAAAELADAQAEVADAEADLAAAQQLPSVSDAQTAVNRAQTALADAQSDLSDAQARANVTAAQTADQVSDRLELIEELEDKIAKAEEAANATEIVAPISGMVYSVAVTDGEKMEDNKVIMIIIPDNTTYSITFTFDTEVANKFEAGTELTPNDSWIDKCTVMTIRPDETNPREKRIVKCSLGGFNIWPGTQLTVTADKTNQDYDHVIPSSAVGRDNTGYYVYVIIESTGPLGDKFVVKRVGVSVDASDGAMSAISCEHIEDIEQGMIVTRSEKPLHNGDRVRMEDYSSDSK